MTDLDASVVGEPPPPYIIFLLVFLFFGTGLLGFLVCHLLKKKGYRCRAGGDEDEDEDVEEKLPLPNDDEEEDNQDTVEQILKCIIENEANMEAFKEMLGNQKVCERHDPRLLRKESLGGIPPHHHTVHSGSDHNSCHLCVQGRSKKARRRSRVPRTKARPGEQTVFSVGRFRVIHTDKKSSLQGSTNLQSADSGDQVDQSDAQDSEKGEEPQQKEGYNLRNMFKDVKQTDSTNGVVSSAMKRKKSLTLFSLRRSSDPQGAKVTIQPMVKEENSPTRVPSPPLPEEADLPKLLSIPNAPPAPKLSPTSVLASTPSPQNALPTCNPTPVLAPSPIPALASTPSPTPALVSTPSPTFALAFTPSPTPALVSTPSPTDLRPTLGHGSTTQSLPLTPTSPRLLVPSPPSACSVSPASPPAPASSHAQSLSSPSSASVHSLAPGTPQSPASFPATASSPALASSPAPAPLSNRSLESTLNLIPATPPVPASSSRSAPVSPRLRLDTNLASPRVSPRLRLDTNLASARVSPSLNRASLTPNTPEEPDLQAQDYRHSPSPDSYNSGCPSSESGSAVRPGERSRMDQGLQGGSLTSVQVGLASPHAGEEGLDTFKSGKLPNASGMPPGRQPPSPGYPASPSSPLMGSVTIVKASPDSTREFSVFRMVELEEGSTGVREVLLEPQREEPVKDLSGIDCMKKQELYLLTSAMREKLPEAQTESPQEEGEGLKAIGEDLRDDMVQMEDIRGCRVSRGEEPESVEEKRNSVLTQQNKF